MDNITSFIHNKATYFLLEDIKKVKVNKPFFSGCKSMRKVVEKNKIPDEQCLYVKKGIVYTKTYNPADVYVEEQYANMNIFNYKKEDKNEIKLIRKEYKEEELTNEPDLIILEDHEMFKDMNGNPMNIEVRGEKTDDRSYFKAKDIGEAFEYRDICYHTCRHDSDYVYNEHYKMFTRPAICRTGKIDSNHENVLYLTYLGVLKLLFCARGHDKVKRFQKWASKILFTIQMGNQEENDCLGADLLNVDVSTVTQILRKSCRAIPCVYLFEVGTVGNMRQHFNLDKFTDDNDKVYKYGRTDDIGRRNKEHCKTYGKLKGNSFGLTLFSYIDEKFVSKAETKLKHEFKNRSLTIDDEKQNELVVIKNQLLKEVSALYDDVYMLCSGNNKELIQQIQKMESDHQIEIKDHKMVLERKDHVIEVLNLQHKNELQEAELKYMRQLLKQN